MSFEVWTRYIPKIPKVINTGSFSRKNTLFFPLGYKKCYCCIIFFYQIPSFVFNQLCLKNSKYTVTVLF